jgi:hypothetical protein|tara:strand:+ start:113 stop:295 length:183 start_codon:yes stop_codon:yes gene_type:complete
MTDQTRWGIPEVQFSNKIKKYQDDNFSKAMTHAERLTKVNLIHFAHKIEQLLKDREEKGE